MFRAGFEVVPDRFFKLTGWAMNIVFLDFSPSSGYLLNKSGANPTLFFNV